MLIRYFWLQCQADCDMSDPKCLMDSWFQLQDRIKKDRKIKEVDKLTDSDMQLMSRDTMIAGMFIWVCNKNKRSLVICVFHKLDEIGNNANIGIRGVTRWNKIQWQNVSPVGIEPLIASDSKSNTLLSTLTWNMLLRRSLNFCSCTTWCLESDDLRESIENNYKIATWRSRSSQIAGSSTTVVAMQQCNIWWHHFATFDDIILNGSRWLAYFIMDFKIMKR